MPRDDAWTYGDAVCDLLGAAQNPEERAKARWQCCAEVLRNLGHYRPQHAPIEPPEVRPLRLLDFEEVRKACEAKPNVARAFGYWRAEVTAWEADNAGKLYCLAWCLLTLIELRAFFEPETVDQAIGHVGDWIERVWRVSVPLRDGADVRTWAQRVTFNFDVLPREWRRV